jgi:hypothetical protein
MVKTDIITSIVGSQRGRATILVIIYVETFKIDIIVFIDKVMCLASQ